MAAAPNREATITGKSPVAAQMITVPKIRIARLAWSKAGNSSDDHSSNTTSSLLRSAVISCGCPWTKRISPSSNRISVIRVLIMRARRWTPNTTQWVLYRKPIIDRFCPTIREAGLTITSVNTRSPSCQRRSSSSLPSRSSGTRRWGSCAKASCNAARVAETTNTSPSKRVISSNGGKYASSPRSMTRSVISW